MEKEAFVKQFSERLNELENIFKEKIKNQLGDKEVVSVPFSRNGLKKLNLNGIVYTIKLSMEVSSNNNKLEKK